MGLMEKTARRQRDMEYKEKYGFADLVEIMALLRSGDGCPWDREQDHESLKKYLIEETYEVLEAIDSGDSGKICEELGDVLLQVVFHAQIAGEAGTFDINDVADGICRKMISRHTHVFGNDRAETPEQVLSNWEAIKRKEKGEPENIYTEGMKSVPQHLPALMRGYKVQQKAAEAGFDWDDTADVIAKVEEEIAELREAYEGGQINKIRDELGDLLFSVINLSRFLGIYPETALTGTTAKFIKRFEFIEKEAKKEGRQLRDMTLKEMDELWEKAKKLCGSTNT